MFLPCFLVQVVGQAKYQMRYGGGVSNVGIARICQFAAWFTNRFAMSVLGVLVPSNFMCFLRTVRHQQEVCMRHIVGILCLKWDGGWGGIGCDGVGWGGMVVDGPWAGLWMGMGVGNGHRERWWSTNLHSFNTQLANCL